MREDDYTGSKIDDDDELSRIEDDLVGMFETELDEDFDSIPDDDGNEMLIYIGGAADGAKTLREAAELLYDLADELLSLSGEGWEIIDNIASGVGTAVRVDSTDDLDELDQSHE